MVDVFPCEDGYTQERALLEQVLPTVQACLRAARTGRPVTVGLKIATSAP